MTPTFWTWATEHWFLTFILALLALRIVSKTLRMLLAPLQPTPVAEPEEEPAVQTTEGASEGEDEETAEDENVVTQGVVVPRTRFERLL